MSRPWSHRPCQRAECDGREARWIAAPYGVEEELCGWHSHFTPRSPTSGGAEVAFALLDVQASSDSYVYI